MKYFALAVAALFLSSVSFAQLVNPGFDQGPDVGWEEYSLNFGTPLCNAECGTCGGPCAPQAGSWYAWFGGIPAVEIGSLTQTFTIPSGTTGELRFYVKVAAAGSTPTVDAVSVLLDGEGMFTVTASQAAQYAEYTLITLDVSSRTDGLTHELEILAGSEGGSNILFDSFALVVDGNPTVGFDQQFNAEKDVVLYPNPANDLVNLHFGHRPSGNAVVRILDASGRVVQQQQMLDIQMKRMTFNTNQLPSGNYFVEILNGDDVMRERFTVVH